MNQREVGLIAVLVGGWLLGGAAAASDAGATADAEVATPIVSEVLGAPGEYAGRRARIHGMVVASLEESGFGLQDVSQQIIQVHNRSDSEPELHSAVTVSGTIIREAGKIRLIADRIDRVDEKVLGGPCGCSSGNARNPTSGL